MFSLSAKDMKVLEEKLNSSEAHAKKCSIKIDHAIGCPNCNGQCKNGCGVTCVSIFS